MKLTKSKLKQIIKEEFSQMSGEANLGGNPSRLRPLNEQDFHEDTESGLWKLFEKIKRKYSYPDATPEEIQETNQEFVQALQDFGEKVMQSRG